MGRASSLKVLRIDIAASSVVQVHELRRSRHVDRNSLRMIRAQVLRHLNAIVRLDQLAIPRRLASVVGPVEVAAL